MARFLNANYLRFDHTGPLEIVLFQRPIRHSIGTDLGAGSEYRPPLSENIVIRGGIATSSRHRLRRHLSPAKPCYPASPV